MRKLTGLTLLVAGCVVFSFARAETLTAEGLSQAARSGDLATIRQYIAAKFDLNKMSGGVPSINIDGSPPISAAAANKQCSAVRLLLEGGARADTNSKYGFTPLTLAAQSGATDCVQALLEKRPRIDVKTAPDGDTPLILASYQGHLEVVKLLVAAGASKTIRNGDGDNALSAAKTLGNSVVVSYLNGVDSAKGIRSQSNGKTTTAASSSKPSSNASTKGLLRDGYIMCESERALNDGTQLIIQGKRGLLGSVGCYSTLATFDGAVLKKGLTRSEVLLRFPSGDSARVWVQSEALSK
ncbi:ankyrin repeat domain-containing protein [Bordetella tumulicola]|uniref:ankyrin repeat domain-containing protein n=1 Tax=Bordetella tumulicola TaxID=1649133 RepID=UPI0039EFEDC0